MSHSRAYAVYLNIFRELPKYRHFTISSSEVNEEDFEKILRAKHIIQIDATYDALERVNIFNYVPREGRRVAIFITARDAPQIKTSDSARRWINQLSSNEKIDEVIIVHEEDALGSSALKRLETIRDFKEYVEVYPFNSFLFVVPQHVQVPPHHFATKQEVAALVHQHIDTGRHLLHILTTDPPCIWIGARPGDIIRIDRISESTLIAAGYRVVRLPE